MISDDGYQDKRKLKEILFKLKERFGVEKIKIATFGERLGMDEFIEDTCLTFDVDYGTFPAYHSNYTIDCIMPTHRFGKEYDARYYFLRENDAVRWADVVFILTRPSGVKKFDRIVKLLKKAEKTIKVFYDKRS